MFSFVSVSAPTASLPTPASVSYMSVTTSRPFSGSEKAQHEDEREYCKNSKPHLKRTLQAKVVS